MIAFDQIFCLNPQTDAGMVIPDQYVRSPILKANCHLVFPYRKVLQGHKQDVSSLFCRASGIDNFLACAVLQVHCLAANLHAEVVVFIRGIECMGNVCLLYTASALRCSCGHQRIVQTCLDNALSGVTVENGSTEIKEAASTCRKLACAMKFCIMHVFPICFACDACMWLRCAQ